jgi:hypothetical protein
MSTYNGHRNRNHWNVSLWINNTESLYRTAKLLLRDLNADAAAHVLLVDLKAQGNGKTPDGAPYSLSAVKAAIRGIR